MAAVVSAVLLAFPARSSAQVNLSALNLKLQQAINAQNWGQAIQIIDQMLVAAPQQTQELKQYRARLETLYKTGVKITPSQRTPATTTPPSTGILGQVAIKRRESGIAIVDVTFNRRLPFEMMVDSGATSTVITRRMATALGITPAQVVDVALVSTANGKVALPIVYVDRIELGGLSLTQVPVLVGEPQMEVGLLGQDFLRHFDVTIRRDVIEFHSRR